MFIAGHAAAGALIGEQIGTNPLLIFLLAVVSHFLLDIIPHGDGHHVHDYFHGGKKKLRSLYNVLLVDTIGTIMLSSWLLAYGNLNRTAVAWGIIGGVIPDFLVGLSELIKHSHLKWFSKMHFKVHNALIYKIKVRPWPGAIGQFLLIGLLLYAL